MTNNNNPVGQARDALATLAAGGTGNLFQDEWLASLTPGELARAQALAVAEGVRISGGTILRPQLRNEYQVGITLAANRTGTLTFYSPYVAFVEKITAVVRGLKFVNGSEPDGFFAGSDFVRPTDYVEGQIVRTTREQIFTGFIPLSEWTGYGDHEYLFGIMPIIGKQETIQINFAVDAAVESIDKLSITLHTRRFPDAGY